MTKWIKETLEALIPLMIALFILILVLSPARADIADVKLLSADIAVTQNIVAGKFKLHNPAGAGDMTRLSLLEMSIRKPGGAFLAIFGPQEMCDPTHQENMHKDYLLSAGETFTLSISTPSLPDGKYEVWCETANACYAENPAAFRSEGPCKGGVRLATLDLRATTDAPTLVPTQPTVGTGGAGQQITVVPGDGGRFPILWKAVAVGLGLIIFAYVLLRFGLLWLALPTFFIGVFIMAFGLRGG